mmetsp:Transcript_28827/g.35070  ORF Transcript_28827/g.35070 Transcript_28827/m.35070 type:complete len:360 (-) Transcript_28827:112-1191(-)|eukprot:CAMPEP_0172504394 /NCGR_PEP_ID=MMETSP1066-20121228/178319_1 /TAXON_ID=671091 /ORGANISM="Coscinodiscus wailesii, Strain CCMP2513" /LENGTH=359 /DNA_ID=CAMNT_0013280569 /DNA_START=136 /DNA_END=1215 /DNA_ORIENTATION=+
MEVRNRSPKNGTPAASVASNDHSMTETQRQQRQDNSPKRTLSIDDHDITKGIEVAANDPERSSESTSNHSTHKNMIVYTDDKVGAFADTVRIAIFSPTKRFRAHDDRCFSAALEKCLAEAFGTFILVFFGCGSVCALVYTEGLVGLGQATTVWSLGAALAIYSTGSISGGHLNPAVSLSFAMMRPVDFSWGSFVLYCFAQMIGATLGGAVNYGMFSTAIANFEKKNGITRGFDSTASAVGFGSYWSNDVSGASQVFLIEIVGTALLTFIIFAVTHKRSNVSSAAVPAIIGAAIGSIIAIIGSLSGGAINPARDMGPRLVTLMAGWGVDSMRGAWVYIVGPMVGGPIGAFLAEKLMGLLI